MAPTASRPKDETLTSVRVAVRVRPFTDAELDAGSRSSLAMPKGPTGGRLSVSDVDTWTVEEFALDHCYGVEGVDGHVGPAATQERLYRDVGEPALDAAWAGYNVGVVAFGQTGTGKTHALVGATQGRGRGITPRLAEALFARVDAERESNDGAETRVEVTAVEIHRERCRDLLERGATVDVNRAAAVSISSLAQLRHVLAGAAARRDPSLSSRSHAVTRITLTRFPASTSATPPPPLVSRLHLVDLAGAERVDDDRSLRALVDVVASAAATSRARGGLEPARGVAAAASSTLPLADALREHFGGNAKTWIVATASPSDADCAMTAATLRFLADARAIRGRAVVNVDPDARELEEAEAEEKDAARALEYARRRFAEARAATQIAADADGSFGVSLGARRPTSAGGRGLADGAVRRGFGASHARPASASARNSAARNSASGDALRFRAETRDARARHEAAVRRLRAARAHWTAKLKHYARGRGDDAKENAPPNETSGKSTTTTRVSRDGGSANPDAAPGDSRASPRARFVPIVDGDATRSIAFDIGVGVTTFGSDPSSDVVLDGLGVRSRHCAATRTAPDPKDPRGVRETVIAPVDAGADVWVNGERIGVVTGATERTLRRGDRVAVGKNSGLVFRFDDEDGATRDAETETPKPSKCSALRTSSSSSRDFAAETATSTTSASASNAEEWWEAQAELRSLAATRALAEAPPPPPFDPATDVDRVTKRVAREGERRRRWREALRRVIVAILPAVDAANATCEATGIRARFDATFAPVAARPKSATRAAVDRSSASTAELASACLRVDVRCISATNADADEPPAASWTAEEFSKRAATLRRLGDAARRDPEAIRRAAKGDAEEDPIRIVEKGRERLSLALALAPTTSPAPTSPPGRSSPPPRASVAWATPPPGRSRPSTTPPSPLSYPPPSPPARAFSSDASDRERALEARAKEAESAAEAAREKAKENKAKYKAKAERAAAECREAMEAAEARARAAEANLRAAQAASRRAVEDAERRAAEAEKKAAERSGAGAGEDDETESAPAPEPARVDVEEVVPGEDDAAAAARLRAEVPALRLRASTAEEHARSVEVILSKVRTEAAMARADKAAEIANRVALTVALDARTKQVGRLEEALRAAREGNGTTTTTTAARAASAESSENAANDSGPPPTTSAPKGTAARIAAKMRRRRAALEPSAKSVEGPSVKGPSVEGPSVEGFSVEGPSVEGFSTLPALAPRVPSSIPVSAPDLGVDRRSAPDELEIDGVPGDIPGGVPSDSDASAARERAPARGTARRPSRWNNLRRNLDDDAVEDAEAAAARRRERERAGSPFHRGGGERSEGRGEDRLVARSEGRGEDRLVARTRSSTTTPTTEGVGAPGGLADVLDEDSDASESGGSDPAVDVRERETSPAKAKGSSEAPAPKKKTKRSLFRRMRGR